MRLPDSLSLPTRGLTPAARARSYLSLFGTLFALHEEEALLKKDLFDGTYSLAAYFLAKSLVVIPHCSAWSFFFTIVTLACTNLAPSAADAAAVVFVSQLSVLTFQGVGLLISASISARNVLTVAVVTITAFFAFSGFFAPPSSMRMWYGWFRYVDPQTYLWQLDMRIVFQPTSTFACGPSTAQSVAVCQGDANRTLTGTDALAYFEADVAGWVCGLVAALIVVGSRVVAFALFWLRARRWRGATLFRSAANKMPDAPPSSAAAKVADAPQNGAPGRDGDHANNNGDDLEGAGDGHAANHASNGGADRTLADVVVGV